MDRKQFLQQSVQCGLGCCAFLTFDLANPRAGGASESTEDTQRVEFERNFLRNWLVDLLEAAQTELDRETQVKLMEATGRGCFRRHQFKQDIALQGKNDLDKLIEAYKKNFEIWKDGERVHIRYGEISKLCYCPAANYRPSKPNDIHCECTRTTHQTIFETALGRPFKVDIVETLRRGGKTCHFVVNLGGESKMDG
ncbi:MAG: hypothetical protein ACE145_01455 [Terriglobia bacterium]